jgi:hypothetical protein
MDINALLCGLSGRLVDETEFSPDQESKNVVTKEEVKTILANLQKVCLEVFMKQGEAFLRDLQKKELGIILANLQKKCTSVFMEQGEVFIRDLRAYTTDRRKRITCTVVQDVSTHLKGVAMQGVEKRLSNFEKDIKENIKELLVAHDQSLQKKVQDETDTVLAQCEKMCLACEKMCLAFDQRLSAVENRPPTFLDMKKIFDISFSHLEGSAEQSKLKKRLDSLEKNQECEYDDIKQMIARVDFAVLHVHRQSEAIQFEQKLQAEVKKLTGRVELLESVIEWMKGRLQ